LLVLFSAIDKQKDVDFWKWYKAKFMGGYQEREVKTDQLTPESSQPKN